MSGAVAATLAPQISEATIITVGGDGGIGSTTLTNPGDSTNLGGLLLTPIVYNSVLTISPSSFRFNIGPAGSGLQLFSALRSTASGLGPSAGTFWEFALFNVVPQEGAVFDSPDNWVPGRFSVNGVNGGSPIWGWLQVGLGASPGEFNPTIISFTYDDAATDATQFAKPVGGFSVVPEPSALGLLGLGLGAAAVARLRRRKRKVSPA